MFITDTPIVFVTDTPTIFVLVFAALLFMCWITLILWVCSVITREFIPDEPNNVELAIQGRSPPPPLTPSPNTLPSSLLRPPPVYISCSHSRSWGNLFINHPLCHQDDHIPSQPLQSPQYYVTPFPREEVRN
jgi:hypothetical protein